MRRFQLAATAIAALASATALAQNASPNNPGATDKMDTPATQGGAMGANPSGDSSGERASNREAWAQLRPRAEYGHVELERRRTRHL